MTKLKLSLPRRPLRWIGIILLFAVFSLYILYPAGAGIVAVWPSKQPVGAPPAGFQPVTLSAAGDVALSAWYAPPENGAVVILIHGAGGSRESVRPYAQMLARNQYGVLALDLQGHGTSEGATNRFGWQNTDDVDAAVTFLSGREEVEHIAGLGLSLGGETLLGAASNNLTLEAVVADGATRRSINDLWSLPAERPLVRNFVQRVMFATVGLLSGDEPPPPLLDSMVAARSTSYLLIAGGAAAQEVAFNELFASKVDGRAQLWVAPDAGHLGAFGRYPDEYEQRVIAFFDTTLLDGSVESDRNRNTQLSAKGKPQ